jgi:transposase
VVRESTEQFSGVGLRSEGIGGSEPTGTSRRHARDHPDQSARVFPTARHLASWAGQCPGNDRSAGKQRSGRTRTGSRWPNQALRDAAMAAIRTRNSYLRAL